MYTNCKRCNRPLKSEESKRRGYGSFCYSKISEKTSITKIEVQEEPIEGQLDILEELKE